MLTRPYERGTAMDQTGLEELRLRLNPNCDICGKLRNKPGGHPKCAKIRQARSAAK